MKKIREWINIQLVKNPGQMVLAAIFLFNVVFLVLSAAVISNLSLSGTEKMGFFEAAFCTITMILDAGCIQFVVSDIGTTGVAVVVICLGIVLVGMISFTGAVIGYVTNYISSFIESANAGSRRLKIYDHSVILNWNTRASEIINDLLYCDSKQKVVVLVDSRKNEIEKEINERIADTVAKENAEVAQHCENMGFLSSFFYKRKHSFSKKKVTVIVREGDIFSSKQLMDISLDKARMIIILGNDINNSVCKFEMKETLDSQGKGNSQTVKTLMQVADITAAQSSADNQKIIVEITDDWTASLVDKIIAYKEVDGKCNIVPVRVNQILGHLLSQFSLMPELNLAYRELFSNKGAAFYSEEHPVKDEREYISSYLKTHRHSLPLTSMKSEDKEYFYYSTASTSDIYKETPVEDTNYSVKLNKNYWIERKNIIILGHNTRCEEIMKGFQSFNSEWGYKNSDEQIVRVVVIDDKKHLEKMDYYEKYPFVIDKVAAEIYEKDLICDTIDKFVTSNTEDTTVLILSDDAAVNEDVDANALANLIYVQDIVNHKVKTIPGFDPSSIDVIVEIIDPKHYDVVNSYSVNNVVISNRYISKMITQIGEKEALFDFYTDILTYDDEEDADGVYDSKEIYIKKVSRFFDEVPKPTTADQFVRAVYNGSIDDSIPKDKQNPTIVLGYVRDETQMVLFSDDQADIKVELTSDDKLIMFSNH
ncbi:MAG: hypothetical protein UH249_04580 [Acutalibacteraceae bacterium]|nr:hypothetical protein [Acutalibacteraceae bacterium]